MIHTPCPSFEVESSLTARYQTTVPAPIRDFLKLEKHDKLQYTINSDGMVLLTRVVKKDDPVLEKFLDFLAHDIAKHPEQLQAADNALFERMQALVAQTEVDLDAELSPEDE